MEARIKNYCKWGVTFALSWNVLLLSVYTIMCLVEGVAFSDNITVDSWLGFYIWYALATLVWFYVGYGLRKEYVTKREVYLSSFKDLDKEKVNRLFKLHFLGGYSKMLTVFFVAAIPWYMIANVRSDLRLKDIIYIAFFMIASLVCLYFTKYTKRKMHG